MGYKAGEGNETAYSNVLFLPHVISNYRFKLRVHVHAPTVTSIKAVGNSDNHPSTTPLKAMGNSDNHPSVTRNLRSQTKGSTIKSFWSFEIPVLSYHLCAASQRTTFLK